MIDAAPPPVWLPPGLQGLAPPAIIRSAERQLLRPGFLPASRRERRAALAELVASGRLSRMDAANALVLKLPPAAAMLLVTQLIGFGAGSEGGEAPSPPATLAFTDTVNDLGTKSSYSFADRAIGTAATGRRVIVGTSASTTSSLNPTVSGVTIGGVAATAIQNDTFGGTGNRRISAGVFNRDLDTGTTATIGVTFTAAVAQCTIVVLALYDWSFGVTYSPTPVKGENIPVTEQDGDAANDTAVDDVFLVYRAHYWATQPSFTHSTEVGTSSDLTEHVDAAVEIPLRHTLATGRIASFSSGAFTQRVTATQTPWATVMITAFFR